MSAKRDRSSAKDILDRVAGNASTASREETITHTRPHVPPKPKRVKKTWTLDVDTLLAIQQIQAHSLRKSGKTLSESKIVDEAVLHLLKEKGLSIE